MIVSGSVSVSPVWPVAISISVPSFGFGFTFLNNMDSSTTVGVVGVWFYYGVGNWGIVVSVWVKISTIDVWVGVDNWFLDFCGLSFNNFFYLFFSSLYCRDGILIVWVPVSVSVWMVDCCSPMGIVIPRICLGFGSAAAAAKRARTTRNFMVEML